MRLADRNVFGVDLNPVAHLIQLCTLVYPQKYGKPDPTARGMTGPENDKGETTWGGLAKEVRYWGEWVLKKVKAEIGDLYPLIPDPAYKKKREPVKDIFGGDVEVPPGYLVPVAYLWTRTVTCKKPTCTATVPLPSNPSGTRVIARKLRTSNPDAMSTTHASVTALVKFHARKICRSGPAKPHMPGLRRPQTRQG